jgi:putative transposase
LSVGGFSRGSLILTGLSKFEELPTRFAVLVHAYALMPNHYHLLLQTPKANLSQAM